MSGKRRRWKLGTVWLTAILCTGGRGFAVESSRIDVEREGEAYTVYAEMVVAIPPAEAFALLSDYDRLDRLSPLVKKSRLLASPQRHRHRVHSVAEMCVLFFCGQVFQVQEVAEIPNREIIALTDPTQSNLKEGIVHWRLAPDPAGTRLTVFARMIPAFWVPPLIGPWAVERALTTEMQETARNLERLGAG